MLKKYHLLLTEKSLFNSHWPIPERNAFEWEFPWFHFDFFLPGYTKCIDIFEGNSVISDVGFPTGKMAQSLIKKIL